MSTKLILIRHGLTAWNLQKRYCGFFDIDLNDKGKAQARKLRERLKTENIHRIYSSDRKRAIHSAKIIFKGSEFETERDLREMHFGIFEGLTHDEIIRKHPRAYKKWLNNPFSTTVPDGESFGEFKKRVQRAFKKIVLANRNKTIAAICHGGVISIFITGILKSRDFWRKIPGPGSLSVVEYKNGRAKIRSFNDTSHLENL